ncbi:MAG: HAD family hydrolase [Synechococcales cyanobacterium]
MPVVLFDFDGTIADTLPHLWQIGERLATEAGYDDLPDLEDLRQLSSREILRTLQIPLLHIPLLVRRLRREMRQEMHHIPVCPGMKPMLESLFRRGWILGIVTSNSSRNVRAFLEHHQLGHWFSLLHSESSLLSKSRVLQRVLQQQHWSVQDVVYVGDETRDVEAARAAGMKVVAVTWGFNSEAALTRVTPQALARDPQELLAILESWFAPV